MGTPEQAPTFDLQSHSQHSDGSLSPQAVVEEAAQAGVELLALTDHDSIDGVTDAAAAAGRSGTGLVPGVEISASDTGGRELHILGYLIDVADHQLGERLERYRDARRQRARAMAEALRELGFELDEEPLLRREAEGKSVGRPHLALAVVSQQANARRLAAEGCSGPSEFLERYLTEGAPAFRPRLRPSVQEAIEVIHRAGGVAVWAHPFWDVAAAAAVIEAIDHFQALGLDGVECFYLTHGREQTELLARHCLERGLLSTGSSDFHGPDHGRFSRFRAFRTYGVEPRLGPIAV